jgi:hypothetical protein
MSGVRLGHHVRAPCAERRRHRPIACSTPYVAPRSPAPLLPSPRCPPPCLPQAYEIVRPGEAESFRDVGNRMLLWHGSRITNWAGIISQVGHAREARHAAASAE